MSPPALCTAATAALLLLLLFERGDALRSMREGHEKGAEQHVRVSLHARAKAAAGDATETHIPHILHFIYLKGFENLPPSVDVKSGYLRLYESCMAVNAHWDAKLWSLAEADQLIADHYPWFLDVWNSYEMEVNKADALRPFVLHHYGGLYLDLDVECYAPVELALRQYDLVLQGSGAEVLNNGMMASVPGHPLWMRLAEVLKERHTGPRHDVIQMTGPLALREAARRIFKETGSGYQPLELEVDGLRSKIYPLGEFFMPCWESDRVCWRQLDRGRTAGTWDMTNLAGRHFFSGSWNRIELLHPERANILAVPSQP